MTRENETNLSGEAGIRPAVLAAAVLVLAAVPFLVFSNTFQNPFIGDDIDFIQRNMDVSMFSWPEGLGKLRPLNKFSYKLNLDVHGFAVPGYHTVNIALHALSGVLLFFLFFRLLEAFAPKGAATGKRACAILAFAGALLFEVHPIHTQAVNYTFARSELLCGVFLFSALYVHAGNNRGRYGYGRGAAVAVLLLLALASKERAFMFIPALILFDLTVRRNERWAERKRRWLKLAVPISVVALLGLLNFYVGFRDQHQGAIGSGREVPELFPYLLTEMGVRLHYLKLYFWPSDLSFDYHFTLHDSPWNPLFLAALFGHLLILAAALALFRREGRVSFGIFWFFLLVLPTAGIVPAALLMHEHWIYIPSFGVFLAVLAVLQWIYARAAARNGARALALPGILVLVALAILLGALSYRRNVVWQSPITLWENASHHAPKRQWVWNNLGVAYLEHGDYEQALEHLAKAEALGDPTPASHLNIGLCLMEQGDLDGALLRMEKARKMAPDRGEIYMALAQLHQRLEKPVRAIDYYLMASRFGAHSPQIFLNIAKLERAAGNLNKAKKHLEKGLKAFPRNAKMKAVLLDLFLEAAKRNAESGAIDKAKQFLKEGLNRFPDNVPLKRKLSELEKENP